MKSLHTLIKLEKRELDRLRKQMNILEDGRDKLIAHMERLQEQLIQELEAASVMPDLRGFFGDFSDAIKKKQRQMATKVVQFEQQIQELNQEVAIHFSELKKYEIARENHQKREKNKRDKREQAELDEVGVRAFFYGDAT